MALVLVVLRASGPPPVVAPPGASAAPASDALSPAPGSSASAVNHGVPVACDPSILGATLHTDHDSYAAGTPVHLTIGATNEGQSRCTVDTIQCGGVINIYDPGGRVVWSDSSAAGCPTVYQGNLDPGLTVSRVVTWDQHVCVPGSCPRTQVPAGTYTARGQWITPAGAIDVSAQVTIS
ncbi:MAG: hypothetical protein ACYDAY_04480 [Candidatus Dormibacteria bacterium]